MEGVCGKRESVDVSWQARVVEEKRELDIKRQALLDFLAAEVLWDRDGGALVSKEERERLMWQAEVMLSYSKILAARIAAFK